MSLFTDFNTISEYMEMGGFVILPLLLVSVLLWYALAKRWLSIKVGKKTPRQVIDEIRQGQLKKDDASTITEQATLIALRYVKQSTSTKELKSKINEQFSLIRSELGHNRVWVRSLVAAAPLLGLLGTVDGMIETFRSLADMALFTQSGGIAGGISKALFTTQMGLAISIPGLLFGRLIERRERQLQMELDQVKDLVSSLSSEYYLKKGASITP